jgi:Cytochrome c oxidase subunit IV
MSEPEPGGSPAGSGDRAGDPGAEPQHLPQPSQWPVIVALAVTLVAFGVVTVAAFSAVGLVLLAWSIAGWIQELRHQPLGHEPHE